MARLVQLVTAQFVCAAVLIAVVWADGLAFGLHRDLPDVALILAWASPFFAAGATLLMHFAQGKPHTWLWTRAALILPLTAAVLCVIDWTLHDAAMTPPS